MRLKFLLFIITILIFNVKGLAQVTDSLSLVENSRPKFKPKDLYFPVGLMVLGTASEIEIKNEVHRFRNRQLPYFRYKFDDYLQFAPDAATYGFEALGMKPRTDWKNRMAIHIKGHLFTLATAHLMKNLIDNKRPNGARMSFPSGHTAYVFSGATILAMEYGENHPWVPYASYATASVVGMMRIANNRHYISDVLFGAGLGILAMKLAYWTHKYKWNRPKTEKDDPFQGVVYNINPTDDTTIDEEN